MDRRPRDQHRDTGELENVPRLEELSDAELGRLSEDIPDAWLDVAAGEDAGAFQEVSAGEGTLDDAALRELLSPLDPAAEEHLAKSIVDGFLRGASSSDDDPGFALGAVSDPGIRTGPLNVVALRPEAQADRSWWGIGLPLAAAAIVLLVLVDGPGLTAVFDDEGRVHPANLTPNATASAKGAKERAKWPSAELPVPGSPSGITAAADVEPRDLEEPAREVLSVPGGLPGGAEEEAAGGVVGGVVGGAAGGVLGGAAGASILGDEVPEPIDARPPGEKTPKDGAVGQRALSKPLASVMALGMFTPDPDPVALRATKAGLFDRRPCTSVIAFCVDSSGRTTSVRSGGRCYDRQVDEICLNTVKKWRFRPFVVEGEAAAVCTEVSFDLRFGKRH